MSTVDIFTLNLKEIEGEWLYFNTLLTTDEVSESLHFQSESLKIKFILTRGILRQVLAEYLNIHSKKIIFLKNKYGKPYIANHKVYFNISHSKDLLSLIIAFDHEIGIDIEFQDFKVLTHHLYNLIFSVEDLSHLPMNNHAFYDGWVIKEAFCKAIGMGLHYPVKSINVINFQKTGIMIDNIFFKTWHYYQLNLPPLYSGAIVSEKSVQNLNYRTIR